MRGARTHLRSAALLAAGDVELAYDALNTANRKALTAVLLAQGLRPTRAGGAHRRVRRRSRPARSTPGTHPGALHADLPLREAIVDVATKVLGKMPPY